MGELGGIDEARRSDERLAVGAGAWLASESDGDLEGAEAGGAIEAHGAREIGGGWGGDGLGGLGEVSRADGEGLFWGGAQGGGPAAEGGEWGPGGILAGVLDIAIPVGELGGGRYHGDLRCLGSSGEAAVWASLFMCAMAAAAPSILVGERWRWRPSSEMGSSVEAAT
jgi:hypothetical protein